MKKRAVLLIVCALALALSAYLVLDAAAKQSSETSDALSTAGSAPSPAPESKALGILSQMSPEEKVWQMLFVYPEDISGLLCCTDSHSWEASLASRPVGGLVFLSENMPSAGQLKAMLAAISSAAETTPFLALDEEGGAVARLSYTLGVTTDFSPMYDYRAEGTETAYKNALTIASDIASFGFNTDFAPVADVWTNPENSVIGRRAYSSDAAEAAGLVAAAVRGFSDGSVISTLKHFPGHGDTAEDSHYSSAYSAKSLDELRQCEFLPFISGIQAGADMVMVGHITLTGIDPSLPATLSKPIVTGLLREELGFSGVVITDAFGMDALGAYSEAEAAVMAIEAGCDMILAPDDPDAVAKALLESVSPERIDQAVLRILELKLDKGLI